MNRGYVKLWRKSMDNPIFANPVLWQFWCYCLMRASHAHCKATVGLQEVALEPGQFVFGRKAAARDLRLTEKKIRWLVYRLKLSQNITLKATNKYSVISIMNWADYQVDDSEKGPSKWPTKGQQRANKGPQTRMIRMLNTIEEKTIDHFETFWMHYPRKVGKPAAIRAWDSATKKGLIPPIDALTKILERHKACSQWTENDGKYIPHPSTWINQARWDDEIEEAGSDLMRWGADTKSSAWFKTPTDKLHNNDDVPFFEEPHE